jgi:hypothetical protein
MAHSRISGMRTRDPKRTLKLLPAEVCFRQTRDFRCVLTGNPLRVGSRMPWQAHSLTVQCHAVPTRVNAECRTFLAFIRC